MNNCDVFLMNIFIWILIIYFIFGFENTFKSLINSEFIWISIFVLYLIYSILFDNINILSMTLFFLIFSAIEISICLILIIFQKKIFKSINVNLFNKSNLENSRNLKTFKYKY